MAKIKSKFLDKLHRDFTNRMKELQAAVDETEFLEGLLQTLETEAAPKKRRGVGPYARTAEVPWPVVQTWFLATYGPTDQYRNRELAEHFDKTPGWAQIRTNKMLKEGMLERYGNGLYRRPAIYTGELARLSVGNGIIN
jgi:hypothetical protein